MSYETKQVGSLIQVIRDGVPIASYDPVTEETTYLKPDYEKYSNHTGRAVNDFLATGQPRERAHEPDGTFSPDDKATPDKDEAFKEAPPEAPEAPQDPKAVIASLKSQLLNAREESVRLRDELAKLRNGSTQGVAPLPERFADVVDLTGAPAQDPKLGDLTPAFIEWARENFAPEVFEKRYRNRLKG